MDCEGLGVKRILAPTLSEWFSESVATHYAFAKTWEQAKSDRWVIIHTSGTTGMPKPIYYTHTMMTMFDAMTVLPPVGEESLMNI